MIQAKMRSLYLEKVATVSDATPRAIGSVHKPCFADVLHVAILCSSVLFSA